MDNALGAATASAGGRAAARTWLDRLLRWALAGALALLLLRLAVAVLLAGRVADGGRTFLLLVHRPLLYAIAAALAGIAYALRARRGAPLLRATAVAAPALAAMLGVSRCDREGPNRYGLAALAPGYSQTHDYSDNARKDAYPRCTIRANSLGYRDEEPDLASPARRVLVIGDSYVWGDGIPTNELTLPALLRRELAARAPGKYQVVAAAFPGLGVYGYLRAFEALGDALEPDVAIVGYLGTADWDPWDFQLLLDRLPALAPVRTWAINLQVLRLFHQMSGLTVRSWTRERMRPWLDAFARHARRRRILFVDYFATGVPAGIEAVVLPPALRYPGRRNAFWYEKDVHPKPPLNRALAALLAERIVSPADPR